MTMKHLFKKLFLLFTIAPFVELYLLMKVAEMTSAGTAIAIVLVTGAIGAYLAKGEGIAVYRSIQADLSYGRVPTDQLLHGLCVLIGGLLLVTPGLITDAIGFTLILPITRRSYVVMMKRMASDRIIHVHQHKDRP